MDGLSSAASVIAVVDISVKVLTLCGEYASAVQGAKEEIERLTCEIEALRLVLESVTDETGCRDALHQCLSELQVIEARLSSKKTSKMTRWGVRALKWPFKKKDVDLLLSALERHKTTLTAALISNINHVRNLVAS